MPIIRRYYRHREFENIKSTLQLLLSHAGHGQYNDPSGYRKPVRVFVICGNIFFMCCQQNNRKCKGKNQTINGTSGYQHFYRLAYN